MRIVFCGTATFAVPSLRAVAGAHDVVAVVTQPDRPGSRGRPAPRPVGEAAAELGLPVLRPERIRAAQSVAEVLALEPDVLVVAAYGQIIPAVLLDTPPHGGVNVHGSVLPRWRGAAPVAAAILAGDPTTGVSIMRMDAGLDTGPVYTTTEIAIAAADTTPSLTERLAALGAGRLVEVLAGLEDGTFPAVPQDESSGDVRAPASPRGRRGGVGVDHRGRPRPPGARVRSPGRRSPRRSPVSPSASSRGPRNPSMPGRPAGSVVHVDGEGAGVATALGVYRVAAVLPPGGRPMTAAAYLRGRRHTASKP